MNPHPLIDIGVNLTNKRFQKDLAEILQRAQQTQVEHMIVTGTSLAASQAALKLTRQYPQLTCTAGVHPHDAKQWQSHYEQEILTLASKSNVVAIGECGLDFNRNFSPKDQQEYCFEAQLNIAVAVQKPVFLHQRDAHSRFMELLKPYRNRMTGAVVHCFTGTKEELFDYLDLDCHIGITGWLCDTRRGQELRNIVKHIPLDKLMIETDAPFLTPHNAKPQPKDRRNEPALLPYVLSELSNCIGISEAALAKQTYTNTQHFFKLP